MAYVPYVPPTQQRPISPQAQELANKIGGVIEQYRGYYPDLSKRDVRDALRAAGGVESQPGARARAVVVALAAGVAALVGVLFASGSPDSASVAPVLPIIVGAGILALGVAFFVRNR